MNLFRCVFNGGVVIVMANSKPEAFQKAQQYVNNNGLKAVDLIFDNVFEHHSDCVLYTFD